MVAYFFKVQLRGKMSMEIIQETRVERWRKVMRVAWPLIIANSFWSLQLTIDRIFLGNFSTEALGAAMAVMGVFGVFMALLQQTAGYVMTFVAQYYGARRFEMIGPAVWQSLYLGTVGGLFILLLIPLADPFFKFVGHADSLRALEVDYFISVLFSALPTALVASASGFFSGIGKTKTIIWINCVGLVANVILDYVMIFGKFGFPVMGIFGAGLATSLATVVSAVVGCYLMFTYKDEHTYGMNRWRIDGDLLKRFVRFGIPSGMQWALEGLAFTVFLICIGRMNEGSAGLAASSIVVTIMMLAVLPPMGIAQANAVLLGQYLGEKTPRRAEATTWSALQMAWIYIFSVGLSFAFFPEFYLSWFHNAENAPLWDQVSVMVPILLVFVAFFTTFDSMNLIFSFALKGAGDTKFVSLVALLLPWPLMIAPTLYFQDHEKGVYLAWVAASIFITLQAVVFFKRFLGGKWKQMSVI